MHIHYYKEIENTEKVMISVKLEFDDNGLLKACEVIWAVVRRESREIAGIAASGMYCTDAAPANDTCFNNALDIASELLKIYDFEIHIDR